MKGVSKKYNLSTLTHWNTVLHGTVDTVETAYVAHSSFSWRMWILKVSITRIHQESENRRCNLLHNTILLEVLTVGDKLNEQGWFGWRWYGEAPSYITHAGLKERPCYLTSKQLSRVQKYTHAFIYYQDLYNSYRLFFLTPNTITINTLTCVY